MQARPVLGLGTPKGATRYLSRLLVTSGIRALHEAKGRDGQVSAFLVVDDWWNPHVKNGGKRSDYLSPIVIHVVRHPLAAISSLVAWDRPDFWHWQQAHTDLTYRPNSLRFTAKFWLKWHDLIEEQNPDARLRAEFAADDWKAVAYATGDASRAFPIVERDATWNNPNKKPLAWDDLGEMSAVVKERATRYGYVE